MVVEGKSLVGSPRIGECRDHCCERNYVPVRHFVEKGSCIIESGTLCVDRDDAIKEKNVI